MKSFCSRGKKEDSIPHKENFKANNERINKWKEADESTVKEKNYFEGKTESQ